MLSFFARKDGRRIGEVSFTRHRVVAHALDQCVISPNRFALDLCPVRSVHDTERSLQQFKRRRIVLSGSTPQVRKQWMEAVQTWRRRNWRESVVISDCADERKALEMAMTAFKLEPNVLRQLDLTTLRKVEMVPEESEQPQHEQPAALNSLAKQQAMAMATRPANRFDFHSARDP